MKKYIAMLILGCAILIWCTQTCRDTTQPKYSYEGYSQIDEADNY